MKIKVFIMLLCFGAKSFSQERDLPYYLQKAMTNAPLLTDLNNQIKSVALDSLINRATYKPQLSGNLNASYAPVVNGFGYDTALSNGHVVSALVGVNQKVWSKNRSLSQAESFRLIKQSLSVDKKIVEKDLEKAITSQYINAWGTSEQIRYNEKNLLLLKNQGIILRKLTQQSIYKQTDYLIFDATLKQQELLALQLKQQYQNDLALLNYLSGETNTNIVSLKTPEIPLKSVGVGKILFAKKLESDSLKIINDDKIIDNNYKPSLSLLADAGYNSSFIYEAYKNFGFSVGLGLTIPIYDGNQRLLQHQKNDAAIETIKAYQNNFKRQYAQQIQMLALKLQQAEETTTALQAQLTVTEALIEANRKLLMTGDAQLTEYILALGNLVMIQSGISQNSVSKLQTVNEINYWKSNE